MESKNICLQLFVFVQDLLGRASQLLVTEPSFGEQATDILFLGGTRCFEGPQLSSDTVLTSWTQMRL